MKFLTSSIPSSIAALLLSAASVEADMLLPAAKECDPNQSVFRMGGGSSSGVCGQGSHCVLNGNSSLGGYCIDDSNKATLMDMPEALGEFCFICEPPSFNDQVRPRSTSHVSRVTTPYHMVGSFSCGELSGLGQEGKIPKAQCHIFQQMIQANDLCGCTPPPPPPPSIDEQESEGEESSSDTTGSFMEESQPFDLSGGSSNTIAIASAASLFAALLLTVP